MQNCNVANNMATLIKNGIKLGKVKRDVLKYVLGQNYRNGTYGITSDPTIDFASLTAKSGRNFYEVIIQLNTDMTWVVTRWWNDWTATWDLSIPLVQQGQFNVTYLGERVWQDTALVMQMKSMVDYLFYFGQTQAACDAVLQNNGYILPKAQKFARVIGVLDATGGNAAIFITHLKALTDQTGLFTPITIINGGTTIQPSFKSLIDQPKQVTTYNAAALTATYLSTNLLKTTQAYY